MFNKKILDYVGDISQIGGLKRISFNSGMAKGVEAIDVDNGDGLIFTVLVDRGLDIGRLCFKNSNISYMSATGVVSPYHYDPRGEEWLRGFAGGFLTTCGLTQAGDPCNVSGVEHGLHGPYSNLQAELTQAFGIWVGDRYEMRIGANVRQARQQTENLLLSREIVCVLGENTLRWKDKISNQGAHPQAFMILYHMNFGYPLINPGCEIIIPAEHTKGWDKYSQSLVGTCAEIAEPDAGAKHCVFLHDMHEDNGKTGFFIADNKQAPRFALSVRYDTNVLHTLGQWRYLCKRDYVMAMEPCNNHIKGLSYEKEHGALQYLQSDQEIEIEFEARFLSGENEIAIERENILGLMGEI